MSQSTRSSARSSAEQNLVSDDETIQVNWCFLSLERPKFKPCIIDIPLRLYNTVSQGSRELFCEALQEYYEFIAKLRSIKFWRPVTLLDEPTETEWQEFLHDDSKRSRIPYTRAFRKMLENIENEEIVHLIVTADALEVLDKSGAALKHPQESLCFGGTIVSPSDGAKPSTFAETQSDEVFFRYCGRPYSREYQVPLTLFDPVFAQFVDDCKTIDFTSKDIDFAFDLKGEMSTFFDPKNTRRDKFNNMMKEIYGIELQENYTFQETDCCMDVYISDTGRPILISVVKNEMAGLDSEPSLQALLYYTEAVKALREDVTSCHPCFTLILVGTFIGFGGCILTDRGMSQHFSILSLAFHMTDNDAFDTLARHLAALKRAVNSLHSIYSKALVVVSPISEPVFCIFPYQRTYSIPGTDNVIVFSYKTKRDDGRLIFDGQTTTGVTICIKFVRKYGQEAHELCAKNEFAPRLFGIEKLPGGWLMVVMEQMDRTWTRLFTLKEERMKKNKALNENEKVIINGRISFCLQLLHGAGIVHGDIRDTNILVKRGDLSQIRVIDFDWADKEGLAQYPEFVNVEPDMGRPKEVEGYGIIKADHDNYMAQGLYTLKSDRYS